MQTDLNIGIIVTCYNRPEYLKKCLQSLKHANINHKNIHLLIIDDASTNKKTINLIKKFNITGIGNLTKIYNRKNKGIHGVLELGYDTLYRLGCDVVLNLDSDAIVKPNFLEMLIFLQVNHPTKIVSVFNTLTLDPVSKAPRHPIIQDHNYYVTKASIGGINMCMIESTYRRYLEPELCKGYNWDWRVCYKIKQAKDYFVVTKNSFIQHIGIDSNFKHLNPDVGYGF